MLAALVAVQPHIDLQRPYVKALQVTAQDRFHLFFEIVHGGSLRPRVPANHTDGSAGCAYDGRPCHHPVRQRYVQAAATLLNNMSFEPLSGHSWPVSELGYLGVAVNRCDRRNLHNLPPPVALQAAAQSNEEDPGHS